MSNLTLQFELVTGAEIVHHASPLGLITSHANTVRCERHGHAAQTFYLDQPDWKKFALPFRMSRRLLRLDKVVVVPVEKNGRWTALIVVRDGLCYHIDLETEKVTRTFRLHLRRSRPMHQSICLSGRGWYYQGEYSSNAQRKPVPVHRSTDQGRSWETIYEFPSGKVRHVHGCFWDPFEEKIWVCTGDFENENYLLVADEEFREVRSLGDGSQRWRTCHLLFTKKSVYWGMDSELETSYVCRYDRATGQTEKILALPGPVWYAKALNDNWLVLATVVENGPSVRDDHVHIFVSQDGQSWHDVYQAKKDNWKMPLFKNGVINFADGSQSSDEFYFSAEGLTGIDGRVYRAKLV